HREGRPHGSSHAPLVRGARRVVARGGDRASRRTGARSGRSKPRVARAAVRSHDPQSKGLLWKRDDRLGGRGCDRRGCLGQTRACARRSRDLAMRSRTRAFFLWVEPRQTRRRVAARRRCRLRTRGRTTRRARFCRSGSSWWARRGRSRRASSRNDRRSGMRRNPMLRGGPHPWRRPVWCSRRTRVGPSRARRLPALAFQNLPPIESPACPGPITGRTIALDELLPDVKKYAAMVAVNPTPASTKPAVAYVRSFFLLSRSSLRREHAWSNFWTSTAFCSSVKLDSLTFERGSTQMLVLVTPIFIDSF